MSSCSTTCWCSRRQASHPTTPSWPPQSLSARSRWCPSSWFAFLSNRLGRQVILRLHDLVPSRWLIRPDRCCFFLVLISVCLDHIQPYPYKTLVLYARLRRRALARVERYVRYGQVTKDFHRVASPGRNAWAKSFCRRSKSGPNLISWRDHRMFNLT